jgi:GNAT superfamily N-acetyltransferase
VTEEVQRNYLEINSIQNLNKVIEPDGDYSLSLLEPINFQLNKFFYKNIGNKNVKTYVFKFKNDLAGFFELIYHDEKKEVEIAYFGLLEEFQNKKLGSYLLFKAIQKSFKGDTNRVWVHTCSLDHKNALNNYIARGMKIFKTETVKI